jgi:hypothetical protein
VIRIGATYLVTLPPNFVKGSEYVLVTELEEGLLIRRIEDKSPLHLQFPLPSSRCRKEEAPS